MNTSTHHTESQARQYLPLGALVPPNDGQINSSQGFIRATASTLLKDGLQQPFQVTEEVDGEGHHTGKYLVKNNVHGLQALQWLAEQGKIFPDLPIFVRHASQHV